MCLSSAVVAVVVAALMLATLSMAAAPAELAGVKKSLAELQPLADDNGGIVHRLATYAFCPDNAFALTKIVKWAATQNKTVPISVRGAARTTRGQAQGVANGIVVDMSCNVGVVINTTNRVAIAKAGTTWIDVIKAAAAQGMRPWVVPHDLGMTVGGTVALGGVGPFSARRGFLSQNILETTVVTGAGLVRACNSKVNADLFNSVLGGMGQTAITYSAKIPLERETGRVSAYLVFYNTFDTFFTGVSNMGLRAGLEGTVAYIFPNKGTGLQYILNRFGSFMQQVPAVAALLNATAGYQPVYMLAVVDLDGKFTLTNQGLVVPLFVNSTFSAYASLLVNGRMSDMKTAPYPYYQPKANVHTIQRLLTAPTKNWLQSSILPLQQQYNELVVELGVYSASTQYLKAPKNTPLMALPPAIGADLVHISVASVGTLPDPAKGLSPWLVTSQLQAKLTSAFQTIRTVVPGTKLYPWGIMPQDIPNFSWAAQFNSTWPAMVAAKQTYDPLNLLGAGVGMF